MVAAAIGSLRAGVAWGLIWVWRITLEMEWWLMEEMMRGLGQRVVLAARAAVALHLSELSNEIGRQQESAGGAGWNFSTEGDLPSLGDRKMGGETPALRRCDAGGETPPLRSPFAERRAG